MSATDRLVALMDHLGLASAYFGTAIPRDISGLATAYPDRLAGIVLCVPSRLDPAPFSTIADRVLMIAGERGPAADATARAADRLPAARRSVLAGYDAPGSWSDAVADRTDEIADLIIGFFARLAASGQAPGRAEFNHGGRKACRHFLPRRGLRPGADAIAVFSGAVAMGAGNPAPRPALHRDNPWRPPFGRCCLARGPRPDANLSGDVPNPDRPDRAAARRDDPRNRLRRRLSGSPAGKPARRRQSHHRGRCEPVPAARSRSVGRGGGSFGADPLHRRQCRDIALRRPFVRLRLFGHRVRGMRRGSGDRRGDARHPPRWASRSCRARARHAAMVEPRLARGNLKQSDNAAALGRAARRCRPQLSTAECAMPVWSTSSAFRRW